MTPAFILKLVLPLTVAGIVAGVAFASDISFSPVVSLTTVFVTTICGLSLAYTQSKSKAGEIWEKEAAAQGARADRLANDIRTIQAEKDAIGAQLVELQVKVAALEQRPDLTQVTRLLDQVMEVMKTQAHAGHEIGQQLLERIQQHHDTMMQLYGEMHECIMEIRDRQNRHRSTDR